MLSNVSSWNTDFPPPSCERCFIYWLEDVNFVGARRPLNRITCTKVTRLNLDVNFAIAISSRQALIADVKFKLPLLSALLLASCEPSAEDAVSWNNKKTIIELQNRITLLSYKSEQLASKEQNISSEADAEKLHQQISAMLVEKRNLNKQITELRSGWDEFRKSILESRRIEVSGKTFEVFEASNGRQFLNAKVTQINDTGVSLTHENGTARLRFDDLSPQWHSYFGLDGEFALAAHEVESGQRIAYERQMDRQLAAISKSEAEQREQRLKEAEKQASARAVAAAARAATSRPLSASVGALGQTSTFYSNRYRSNYSSYTRHPTVRYHYTNSCTPSHTHIPFWNSGSGWNGTGSCVRPIQAPVPFFQPNH
jgi:hypothetical protein